MANDPPAQPADSDIRIVFEESIAGRRATCEGGAQVSPGAKVGGRETFTGTVTGEVLLQGDPAWRWYKMADLTLGPPGYSEDHVWCEESFVFFEDEED